MNSNDFDFVVFFDLEYYISFPISFTLLSVDPNARNINNRLTKIMLGPSHRHVTPIRPSTCTSTASQLILIHSSMTLCPPRSICIHLLSLAPSLFLIPCFHRYAQPTGFSAMSQLLGEVRSQVAGVFNRVTACRPECEASEVAGGPRST